MFDECVIPVEINLDQVINVIAKEDIQTHTHTRANIRTYTHTTIFRISTRTQLHTHRHTHAPTPPPHTHKMIEKDSDLFIYLLSESVSQ